MLIMLDKEESVKEVYPVSSAHFRLLQIADLQSEIKKVKSERRVFKEPFGSI